MCAFVDPGEGVAIVYAVALVGPGAAIAFRLLTVCVFGGDITFCVQLAHHSLVRSPQPYMSSAEWVQGGRSEESQEGRHRSLCPPGDFVCQRHLVRVDTN